MARLAVIRTSDNVIINMIVGDMGVTNPPDDCFLVDADNFPYADMGWVYDPVMVDFVPPAEVTDGN